MQPLHADANFRLLFASNPLPMWVYDVATLEFLEVNTAAITQYGYSRDEFLSMRIIDIRPPEDIAPLIENVARARADDTREIRDDERTWHHQFSDGRVRDVEINAQTIDFAGRRGVLVVVNDITDLKRAQQALAKTSERLSILHEIDKAVIAAETPEDIAEPAMRRLRELLDVPRAIISLYDAGRNEFEWLVAVGRHRVRRGPGVRFSNVYMGDIAGLRRGEVQLVQTASLPAGPEVEGLLGSDVRAYIVVPMIAKGELIGGVSFGGARADFSEEQIHMAREVAAQLAIAIAQARLYEGARQHAEILERRVAERTLELRDANLQLKQEIENRTAAQTEADRANRLKSEFLANMSHELRTPLNAIIGFTELIHDGLVEPGSAQYMEFLGDILSSSHHLLQLINDILDLSKVEAGKLEFHPQAVALEVVIGEVLAILRTTASVKDIRMSAELDPDIAEVVLDPARLKQVLYNYVSNALKFTPQGGRIVVRTSASGDDPAMFRLAVEDSGIGIGSVDLARLFVEFQQLDGGSAKQHSGTGLGLALTKRLVEAQGGQVGVSSELGRGSTFHATLPRRAAGDVRVIAPSAMPGGYDGAPAILVIEDNERERDALVRTLSGAGYAVDTASTGAQAIEICMQQTFDAIVLDLLLPDRTGLDVLHEIRASTPNRDVPVTVLTVVTEKGALAGFAVHDLLAKPLDGGALLASLARANLRPQCSGDVLVVDDDAGSRRLMAATLRQLGYTPACASDGEAALRIARETPPLAVVLDLVMPVMDGFTFLDRLRELPACRNVPVIVWTVKDLGAAEYTRLRASAQAVVSKGHAGAAAVVRELQVALSLSLALGRRQAADTR
ncbi:MAG TPA: response regulator [Casimicrobiaceae bacterium]